MQNLVKTLHFDFNLFKALPFLVWIKMTFSKYKCIFLILINKGPSNFYIGKQKIEVSTIGDIGTTISNFSDEYFHLYKVVGENVKTIVDIGANIGQFTNAVKYWYPESTVHAFEADPVTYEILTKNTNLKNVYVYNKALSDSKGVFNFYRAPLSGMSSLIKTVENQEQIVVETDTVDSALKDINEIDILKIDVEGAELKVLKGAYNTLKKTKYLLLEISFDRNTENITNLDVLNEVRLISRGAKIIRTGRPLGWGTVVTAQDFLIKLENK